MNKQEFMERHHLSKEAYERAICECEDFPCCGHNREDRHTTWKDLHISIERDLERMDESDY